MTPQIHARSSARKWGGEWQDYLDIHLFLDSSKGELPDPRHRALTHNSFFIHHVIPRVFGDTFTNSAGSVVSVRQVGEQHVSEDYGGKFIPTAGDFLYLLPLEEWMLNGKKGKPLSQQRQQRQKVNIDE